MLKGKIKTIKSELPYIALTASIVYFLHVMFLSFWEHVALVLLSAVVMVFNIRPTAAAIVIFLFAGSIHATLGLKGNVFAIYHDGGVIAYTARDRDINWQRVKKIKEENSVNSIRLVEKTGTAFMSGK